MTSRKPKEENPDGPPSYEDEITSEVSVTVTGVDLADVIANAKIETAKALGTRPENMYVVSNLPLRLAARERFGDQPVLWQSLVVCGLMPEHLRLH
jgi:hypothetical protein